MQNDNFLETRSLWPTRPVTNHLRGRYGTNCGAASFRKGIATGAGSL